MLFEYAYAGSTSVANAPNATSMSFAPDLNRQPTYFRGELRQSVAFREAISALHAVVVSDLRFQPKDRTAYLEWAASREDVDWMLVEEQRADVTARITALRRELVEINERSRERMAPYWKAMQAFREYVWKKERDIAWILDPVITVHPDEVFFECFSKDESTYARLGAGFEVFKNVGEFSCGTTNVDYSYALYDEFQKVRSYKTTKLEVDPSGFEVQTTHAAAHKEVKIDLPDSWVRGFLQVNSAMALPTTSFVLDPMDVHNICLVLRRRRERRGPRSMRYHLTPGEPVRIVFEPWEHEIVCPRSSYAGREATTIRAWGRRRLLTLERLIPVARSVTVHLLGTGMPSFYVADLGDMSFTLGLSGWTANDWAGAGNFDLLAPRADVDELTKRRVFEGLGETLYEAPDALAARLGLDRAVVLGALSAYAQAGRAIFDLNKRVYRVRELSREPLALDALRFANPREASASRFIAGGFVRVTERTPDTAGNISLLGTVADADKRYDVTLTLDGDERILRAACTCNWHQQNKLFKGPCEHILALRLQHARSGV
jgi:hypothetical protein